MKRHLKTPSKHLAVAIFAKKGLMALTGQGLIANGTFSGGIIWENPVDRWIGQRVNEFANDVRHVFFLLKRCPLQSSFLLFRKSYSEGKRLHFVTTAVLQLRGRCSNIVAAVGSKKRKMGRWAECTYCGSIASSYDHVIPLTYSSPTGRRDGFENISRNKVVPACGECNTLLSSFAFFDIPSRAGYLAQRLAIRHRKVLEAPAWSKEEMKALDGTLRSFVSAKQKQKLLELERIRHCLLVASLPDLNLEDVWKAFDRGESLTEYIAGVKEEVFKKQQEETQHLGGEAV